MSHTPLPLSWQSFGEQGQPPLVILHGFLASGRNWRGIAQHLSEHFWVLVPDLRNHGASPKHPIMNYPAMAGDITALLDTLHLPDAHILGHSMGGKVAMWLALNHPDRVGRLVVADIAPKTYRHDFKAILSALQGLNVKALRSRKHADTCLADAIPKPALRQFLLQNLQLEQGQLQWRVDLDILERAGPLISGFPETTGLYPFSGQCLFVFGEHSEFFDEAAITPLFPGAELTVIAEAGHWLHAEQPERFLHSVGVFLAS
ncbi:MAG: alpha/beta fold hydrolase [Methylococcales bacterium]|nr:alpha/beta fold hydrolase [Methylococcales bacterium]